MRVTVEPLSLIKEDKMCKQIQVGCNWEVQREITNFCVIIYTAGRQAFNNEYWYFRFAMTRMRGASVRLNVD